MIMDKFEHIILLNNPRMCYLYKLQHTNVKKDRQTIPLNIGGGIIEKYLSRSRLVAQLDTHQRINEFWDLQKFPTYKNIRIFLLIIRQKCFSCGDTPQHICW